MAVVVDIIVLQFIVLQFIVLDIIVLQIHIGIDNLHLLNSIPDQLKSLAHFWPYC
jgi:hypothetical protein